MSDLDYTNTVRTLTPEGNEVFELSINHHHTAENKHRHAINISETDKPSNAVVLEEIDFTKQQTTRLKRVRQQVNVLSDKLDGCADPISPSVDKTVFP